MSHTKAPITNWNWKALTLIGGFQPVLYLNRFDLYMSYACFSLDEFAWKQELRKKNEGERSGQKNNPRTIAKCLRRQINCGHALVFLCKCFFAFVRFLLSLSISLSLTCLAPFSSNAHIVHKICSCVTLNGETIVFRQRINVIIVTRYILKLHFSLLFSKCASLYSARDFRYLKLKFHTKRIRTHWRKRQIVKRTHIFQFVWLMNLKSVTWQIFGFFFWFCFVCKRN